MYASQTLHSYSDTGTRGWFHAYTCLCILSGVLVVLVTTTIYVMSR